MFETLDNQLYLRTPVTLGLPKQESKSPRVKQGVPKSAIMFPGLFRLYYFAPPDGLTLHDYGVESPILRGLSPSSNRRKRSTIPNLPKMPLGRY